MEKFLRRREERRREVGFGLDQEGGREGERKGIGFGSKGKFWQRDRDLRSYHVERINWDALLR